MGLRSATEDDIATAFRVVLRILEKWECSDAEKQAVLGAPPSTLSDRSLSDSEVKRISAILNIHAGLRRMFNNPNNVYGFVRKKNNNPPFHGKKPIDCMAGDGVFEVMNHILELSEARF